MQTDHGALDSHIHGQSCLGSYYALACYGPLAALTCSVSLICTSVVQQGVHTKAETSQHIECMRRHQEAHEQQ